VRDQSNNNRDHRRLYYTGRWQRLRLHQLQIEPLCEICKDKGLTTAAEVVHHLTPHKGDKNIFFLSKLQSLCKHCHDGITQHEERAGYSNEIGVDGYPIDINHPFYKGRTNKR
jgi:5-methylcytosine-specific restriction enzyme A